MDETTNANRDQSSGGEGGTTSTDEPITFTEADKQKAVSDALAKAGRETKVLEQKEATIQAREQTLKDAEVDATKWRSERTTAELDAAKDDPEKLTLIREREKLRDEADQLAKARRELDKTTLENQAVVDAAKIVTRDTLIKTLATKYSVDARLLDKPYLETTEALEDYAKILSGQKPEAPAPEGTPPGPDSGRQTTVSGQLTAEQIDKMTPEEYAAHPTVIARFK